MSIAKALYADADIYLLDDPLSALDPKISKKIYRQVIRKHLANKIVIMITHNLKHVIKVYLLSFF